MKYYVDEVFERIENADPSDIVPVLVTAGGCDDDANRAQAQLFGAIDDLGEELPNLLVVCYDPDELPWPLPLHPVMYYFRPGDKDHDPMFQTYRGVTTEALQRDLPRARRMYHDGLSFEEAAYTDEELEDIRRTEEELEEELSDPEYPSALKMIRSLGREAWKAAKAQGRGLPVLASKETTARRFNICQACPHFTGDGRCTKCGCFMKTKVNLETAECPVGKW